MSLDDAMAVRDVLEGHVDTFRVLVERYKYLVGNLCYERTHNASEAEELTQEAFVQSYQKLRILRDPAKFKAWLVKITLRCCKEWARRRRLEIKAKAQMIREAEASYSPDMNGQLCNEELMAQVQRLPDAYRVPLLMRFHQGLTVEEIAAALDLRKATVRMRLSRAFGLLRVRLSERRDLP
jgi:RNA polymerase sigma-70 factor (ECF subfamily)